MFSALAIVISGVQAASTPTAANVRKTTFDYVVAFYPRWFYYSQLALQLALGNPNHLVGPRTISPIYHAVVAINDDTLYASAFVDLSKGPVMLTVPSTTDTYSLLTLDMFGDIFKTNVPSPGTPGAPEATYQLTGPGWKGRVLPGAIHVPVPFALSLWAFRADKYSPTGVDFRLEAEAFRRGLRLLSLSEYRTDPSQGATDIVSEALFGVPFKQIADAQIAYVPIRFLKQLQRAVHSPGTPLTAGERALSTRFDRLFKTRSAPRRRVAFAEGVQTAHSAILDNYLSNKGSTNGESECRFEQTVIPRRVQASTSMWGKTLR